jgi:hypothetical protein
VILALYFLFCLFSLGQQFLYFILQTFILLSLGGLVIVVFGFFGWFLLGLLAYYWLEWVTIDSFRDVDLLYTRAMWTVYGLGIVISFWGSQPPLSWISGFIIMIPGLLVVAAGLLIRLSEKSAKWS